MQVKFYQFKQEPFLETPDIHLYYASDGHKRVLEKMATHIDQGQGFMALTGEVGTGKTILTRYFIHKCATLCPDEINTAYLHWPETKEENLIKSICREFGLQDDENRFEDLEKFLLKNISQGKRSLLFVDETQALPLKIIETIRLISNLECQTKKLIQIILIGQPELLKLLSQNEARQIKQRISLWTSLRSLTFRETENYIKYRLESVNGQTQVRFDLSAYKIIYDFSEGIPRLINLACRTALHFSAKENARIIEKKLIINSLKDANLLEAKRFYFFGKETLYNNRLGP